MQIIPMYSKIENFKKTDYSPKSAQIMPKEMGLKKDTISFGGWGKWLPEKLNILGRTKEQLTDLAEYFNDEGVFEVAQASRINKFWFFKDEELSKKAFNLLNNAVTEVKAYKAALKNEFKSLSEKAKSELLPEEEERIQFINSEFQRFRTKSERLNKDFRARETDDRYDSIDTTFNNILDNPFQP